MNVAFAVAPVVNQKRNARLSEQIVKLSRVSGRRKNNMLEIVRNGKTNYIRIWTAVALNGRENSEVLAMQQMFDFFKQVMGAFHNISNLSAIDLFNNNIKTE
jgi:hypothetical protein